jgi:hypothetical protein
MAGYNAVLELRRLEQAVDELGFMLAAPRTGNWGSDTDRVSLKPKDAGMPVYSRDAEVFTGTLEQLQVWIRGVQWAREYDRMVVDKNIDKKRKRKEQDERNRQLMATIKNSELKTGSLNPEDC